MRRKVSQHRGVVSRLHSRPLQAHDCLDLLFTTLRRLHHVGKNISPGKVIEGAPVGDWGRNVQSSTCPAADPTSIQRLQDGPVPYSSPRARRGRSSSTARRDAPSRPDKLTRRGREVPARRGIVQKEPSSVSVQERKEPPSGGTSSEDSLPEPNKTSLNSPLYGAPSTYSSIISAISSVRSQTVLEGAMLLRKAPQSQTAPQALAPAPGIFNWTTRPLHAQRN